jgi:hypothetical protein
MAHLSLPGEISASRKEIQVFGSALPRPKSPFGSREVRVSWGTRTSSGTLVSKFGILAHPLGLLSAIPWRHPLAAPPNIAWSEWGHAARLVPGFDYVYGASQANPRRWAYLELEHPAASTQRRTEPSVLGDRLQVNQVRVVEFGRIGPSAPIEVNTRATLSIFRDKILGMPVAPLAYILERNRPPQGLDLFEYFIHCDEERIVVIDVSNAIFLPVVSCSRGSHDFSLVF